MKQFITLITLSFCLLSYSFAQESPGSTIYSQHGNFNFSFLHLRPLEELSLNSYQNGYGANMEWFTNDIGERFPVNLQAGFRLSITNHGRYKAEVQLVEPVDAKADYRLVNSQLGMGGVIRLITKDAPVRIYADVMGGMQSFSTSESYDLIGAFPGYQDYTSDAVLTTWGYNYGGAAGVQVRINSEVSLDFKALYQRGNHAKFANLSSISQIENQVDYSTVESSTTQWGLQAGFTFKMFSGDNDCCCDD